MLINMPTDRQKKIIAEFKGDDSEKLYELLREMGRGEPIMSLIESTRDQINGIDRN